MCYEAHCDDEAEAACAALATLHLGPLLICTVKIVVGKWFGNREGAFWSVEEQNSA